MRLTQGTQKAEMTVTVAVQSSTRKKLRGREFVLNLKKDEFKFRMD